VLPGVVLPPHRLVFSHGSSISDSPLVLAGFPTMRSARDLVGAHTGWKADREAAWAAAEPLQKGTKLQVQQKRSSQPVPIKSYPMGFCALQY
jgi:hypothetical protein